jgi:hypothetical protein
MKGAEGEEGISGVSDRVEIESLNCANFHLHDEFFRQVKCDFHV